MKRAPITGLPRLPAVRGRATCACGCRWKSVRMTTFSWTTKGPFQALDREITYHPPCPRCGDNPRTFWNQT